MIGHENAAACELTDTPVTGHDNNETTLVAAHGQSKNKMAMVNKQVGRLGSRVGGRVLQSKDKLRKLLHWPQMLSGLLLRKLGCWTYNAEVVGLTPG